MLQALPRRFFGDDGALFPEQNAPNNSISILVQLPVGDNKSTSSTKFIAMAKQVKNEDIMSSKEVTKYLI